MNQRGEAAVNPKPAEALIAGHFGELVQGRLGASGPVALVTLPCPALVTRVRYLPGRGHVASAETQSGKALRAARAALAHVGAAGWGGEIAIERPCPTGLGAGTSTAEALGAVRAVAAAFGVRLAAEVEASLCLAAEGAVDPLMHEGAVLFASREARVIERLPPLPPLRIVGGFAGEARETDPADDAFADAAEIMRDLRAALASGDAAAVGDAATRSAAANQRLRPNPAYEALRSIAAATGALGVAIGHTGAAAALLLPRDATPPDAPALARAGLRGVIGWTIG